MAVFLNREMKPVRATGDRRTSVWRRGFSLVEALIAVVVVIIGLVGIFGTIAGSFTFTEQDSLRVQAVVASQQYLDALRQYVQNNGNTALPAAPAITVDPGASVTGSGGPTTPLGNFALTSNGCPLVAGSTVRYDCVVTSSWTLGSVTKSVTVETYVTHQ